MVLTRSGQKPGTHNHALKKRTRVRSQKKKATKQKQRQGAIKETTETTTAGTGFMDLPPEIRLEIYGYFNDFEGRVVVFSRHDLARNVDKDATKLLHLNRTIRHEMSEAFYLKQSFQIRSIPAMKGFLERVGPVYSCVISHIELGAALCHSMELEKLFPEIMHKLPGLQRLTIVDASKDWRELVSSTYTSIGSYGLQHTFSCFKVIAGPRAISLLKAAPRLGRGKMYYLDDWYQPELHFVPPGVIYTNARQENQIRESGQYPCYSHIVEVPMPQVRKLEHYGVTIDLTGD